MSKIVFSNVWNKAVTGYIIDHNFKPTQASFLIRNLDDIIFSLQILDLYNSFES